jgi:cholesterol transport system auxiliary component
MMKISVILLMTLLLSACSIAHKSNPAIAIYDFGIQPSQQATVTNKQQHEKIRNLLVTDVESAPGFDNHAIYFRLAYNNPTRSYTYANSRWAAAPAILLSQQLRNRIITKTDNLVIKDSSTAKSDYALHIELEEFTQVFDTIDSSHAVIRMRASLVKRQSHVLLAQQTFSVKQNAATADAPGAVNALTTASNLLINELIDWLANALANKSS